MERTIRQLWESHSLIPIITNDIPNFLQMSSFLVQTVKEQNIWCYQVQNISASQLRHCCCCIKTLKHNTCKLKVVLFMLQRGLFGLTSTLFTHTTLMRVLVYAFSTLHRSLIKRITILYEKQEYWIIKDRHAIFKSSSVSASPAGHIWGWRWLQLWGS